MSGILCGVFCLRGWHGVWFVALQDLTLVCSNVCCPLSLVFGLFVWSRRRRSLFLSLSLRRWGNPNPLRGVWGSPCVLSFLDAVYVFNPYVFLFTYTKASPRTCFFFFLFFVAVARFLVVVVLGLWWLLSASPSRWFCCVACMQTRLTKKGWPTRRRPNYDCNHSFVLG